MKDRLRSLSVVAAFLSAACGSSGPRSVATSDARSMDATTLDAAPLDSGQAGGAETGADEAGPVVPASITVDPSTKLGTIGAGFVGLSYEKSHLEGGFFRGDNAALVAMFDLLGPSVLRVGGNSVDSTVWQTYDAGAPSGDAAAPTPITTADVDGLASLA